MIGRRFDRSAAGRVVLNNLMRVSRWGRVDALVEQEDSGEPTTGSVALLAAIRRRGPTASAAARLANLDVAGVARFLSGERTLSQSSIDKLAAGLGLSLQQARSFPE